jgi:hypothetical protein
MSGACRKIKKIGQLPRSFWALNVREKEAEMIEI